MARPKKHSTSNYDYSRIDNHPKCKEDTYICPKCRERDNKERLGHLHQFVNPESIDEVNDKCEIMEEIIHCHFCLVKGTKAPALDAGRNVRCLVNRLKDEPLREWCEQRWIVKRERKKKGKPSWLHREYRGDDD